MSEPEDRRWKSTTSGSGRPDGGASRYHPVGYAYRYPPEEEKTEEAPTEERVRSVIEDIRSLFAALRPCQGL